MDSVSQLFALAAAYGDALKLAEASVSTRVLAGGSRLAQIRSGKDIGVRRLQIAIEWFAEHWPEGVDWPTDVPRPEPTAAAANEEGAAA